MDVQVLVEIFIYTYQKILPTRDGQPRIRMWDWNRTRPSTHDWTGYTIHPIAVACIY